MITPIIIPMGNSEKPKCPSCNKNESKKEVCSHCGHEYEYVSLNFMERVIVFFLIVGFVWLIVTLVSWLFVNLDNKSLFEIIKIQWDWLTSLRIW